MGFAAKFAFWFAWWLVLGIVGVFVPRPFEFGPLYYFLAVLGISLMLYGLLLNAIAGRTLKKRGHFDIKKGIKKPERLVTTGIYSCMRHPAQFGSIFFGIGVAIATANIYAILTAGWFAFTAIYFILALEERETLREFGEEYANFLAKRKPFTFSPNCLKKGIRELKK